MKRSADPTDPQANVAAIFLKQGQPFAPGDRLVQPELAETLKLVARDGPDAFYRGPIAEAIVAVLEMGWVTGQTVLADGGLALQSPIDTYGQVQKLRSRRG